MLAKQLSPSNAWNAPPKAALISDEYRDVITKMHETTPTWGVLGQHFAPLVKGLYATFGCKSILDYGCGKRSLQEALGFPINNYDPGIPECSARPQPADLVVCTDVLEHVEQESLTAVLDDIRSLSSDKVLLTIATQPATQTLPDGRNAHLIVWSYHRWLPLLWERWDVLSIGRDPKRIVFIGEAV